MEGDPFGFVRKHETRGDQQLRKVIRLYAVGQMSLEIDPRLLQQINRSRTERILRQVKVEVELPRAYFLRQVPIRVAERQPNLDDLKQVDVTSHRLVVVVRGCTKSAYWSRHDTGELCVLRTANVRSSMTTANLCADSPWPRTDIVQWCHELRASPLRGWTPIPHVFAPTCG